MTTKFKFGCDPELFLLDKETGKHVSAYGMIEGTKENPLKVEKGAVQVDGMALEFNIDPVDNAKDWEENITTVLRQLRGMIDERYEFSFVPVAHFGKEYIDAQPKKAKELGCDPDYNAYTGNSNPVPDGDRGFRTASGHVHVGWTDDIDPYDPGHFEAGQMLTKQLDFSIGLGRLLWDVDTVRSELYGKFGAFRPKSYGMEYRVLSNVWVKHKLLRHIVFQNVKYATEYLIRGDKYYFRGGEENTEEGAINSNLKYLEERNSVDSVVGYLPSTLNNNYGSISPYIIKSGTYTYYKLGENVHLFDEPEMKEDKKIVNSGSTDSKENFINYDELDELEVAAL